MHGQQNIYKKNIDRSVKCVILDLPNTFYQTFHNISYFECLRSVKMEAVPVSYTSSHPRKWHSSLSPPKAPNISNYNWDRNVAGITNSTRNRHATHELPVSDIAIFCYCRRWSLCQEILKMVLCQHLLIACLLFRIIFLGDFASLRVRTHYATHTQEPEDQGHE